MALWTAEAMRAFWQKRYYDFNVFSERKHVEKLRYMHRNPVKRGLVESPELWRWSSFRDYRLGEPGAVRLWVESSHPLLRKGVGHPLLYLEGKRKSGPPAFTGVSGGVGGVGAVIAGGDVVYNYRIGEVSGFWFWRCSNWTEWWPFSKYQCRTR